MDTKSLKILLALILLAGFSGRARAQIKPERFKPFTKNLEIIQSSGPGLTNGSGDILLELKEQYDEDTKTLMLLRNNKGKLSKIAENSHILMGNGMLGNSGGGNATLEGNQLVVAWGIGSNSGYSRISIVFEKTANGKYEFKKYRSNNYNYGVENLFTRTGINKTQTGPIDFAIADEVLIFKKADLKYDDELRNDPVNAGSANVNSKLIPKGWTADIAVYGDLNLDAWKKDLLLVIHNDNTAQIRLLMQQKDGSYQLAQKNTLLLKPEGNTPFVPNIRGVIKNGFFTIEQRVPTSFDDFDHRYITFKYDAKANNWFLHRYDAEHYPDYSPKPAKDVIHLTKEHFGTIAFSQLDYTPGDYRYEPEKAVITGVLNQKTVYGPPGYGKNPDKDQKKNILVLKPDYPVNVYPDITAGMLTEGNQEDPETADYPIVKQTELQTYSTNHKMNTTLSQLLNKKVKLKGTLSRGRTGGQYTSVIFQVEQILP